MKKTKDEMRAEYKRSDFTKLERGKFYKQVAKGTSVALLDPAIAKAFPTSEAVNAALLGLLTLTEQTARLTSQPKRAVARKADKQLFVEKRPEGDFAVRKANSERASDVLPTQAEAIARAKKLSPGAAPLVERVRKTEGGKPDQWRKA
jgi:hypothetical protein